MALKTIEEIEADLQAGGQRMAWARRLIGQILINGPKSPAFYLNYQEWKRDRAVYFKALGGFGLTEDQDERTVETKVDSSPKVG